MKHQFLCPAVISVIIASTKQPITKLRDLVKLSGAMMCEVESEVEPLLL